MKNLLLAFLIVFSITAAKASILLTCTPDSSIDGWNSLHLLYKSGFDFECNSIKVTDKPSVGLTKNRKFQGSFANRGPGLFMGFQEEFTIVCPTLKAKALGRSVYLNNNGKEKKGTTELYGFRAEAGATIGANISMYSNNKAGICIVAGIEIGTGAAISGSKLTINEIE